MAKEEKNIEKIDPEEMKKRLRETAQEIREKSRIANEAMAEGKGILTLEKPIRAGGEDIKELIYDFNELTGLEYADAMDSDPTSQQTLKITYKQALNLFAKAAQKETDKVDARDITEQLSMTDASAAIRLATLFFSASMRAGLLRISKKS